MESSDSDSTFQAEMYKIVHMLLGKPTRYDFLDFKPANIAYHLEGFLESSWYINEVKASYCDFDKFVLTLSRDDAEGLKNMIVALKGALTYYQNMKFPAIDDNVLKFGRTQLFLACARLESSLETIDLHLKLSTK